LPGTGANAFSFDNTHNFTTTSLVAPGSAFIRNPQGYRITALEPGWSTFMVNYQFQETGTVPVGGTLTSHASVSATSDGFGDHFQQIQTTVPTGQSLNIARTIAGTFTGSVFFDTIGSSTDLSVGTSSRIQYVPVPDTFWLFLGGLASLVAWRERRKWSL
jgi:hypothetical protein